nr:uncharacterized mitochondrial protein AtMg00810-like [Tanacetum cinerariifolium]
MGPKTSVLFPDVARMEAIRIFLAFATYMNFKVYQMDAKNAFLNVKTPMVPPNNLGLDSAGKPVNETLYKGMIGSLMYLTATRPDIQFLTVLCGFDLKGYSDSDYDGCNMDRKSTPGAYQLLGGKLVCQSAKKQQSVAMSSTKAEYIVAAGCCASILWMKSQLSDYDIHYKMVPIFCDNTSAIAISNNPVLHSRTKHIDIRYHFINSAEIFSTQTCGSSSTLQMIRSKVLFVNRVSYKDSHLLVYQNFLREFWSTAVAFDPFPSTDEPEKRPLKEFLIKFSVSNWQRPLTLDF